MFCVAPNQELIAYTSKATMALIHPFFSLPPHFYFCRNSYAVQNMAVAADKGQLLVLRAMLLRDCYHANWAHLPSCNQESIDGYHNLLITNTEHMRFCHHGLYLGFNALKQFADKRLMVSYCLSRNRC